MSPSAARQSPARFLSMYRHASFTFLVGCVLEPRNRLTVAGAIDDQLYWAWTLASVCFFVTMRARSAAAFGGRPSRAPFITIHEL